MSIPMQDKELHAIIRKIPTWLIYGFGKASLRDYSLAGLSHTFYK